ncbi:hypothetical protein OG921_14230 [Aldersonia sp. NBC_00410]|uniref:hypothetical protein n=1 Tax=Aldersonia sp. NBC_00410 TaxID=2975954 RepID=UPI002258AE28|nr:hypothetical protein [Aldersonia sp. NBC_00410]MCX5044323.1 hypothetical protein [Aldersonia sp. NBC_00410]
MTAIASGVEWVAAAVALSKFAHLFVVAGLLVVLYRWSRRHPESPERRRGSPPGQSDSEIRPRRRR